MKALVKIYGLRFTLLLGRELVSSMDSNAHVHIYFGQEWEHIWLPYGVNIAAYRFQL